MGLLQLAESVAAASTQEAVAMLRLNGPCDCGAPGGPDFRDEVIDLLYRDFDGQEYECVKVFGAFRFLPFEKAVDYWTRRCRYNTVAARCLDDRLKGGFEWREGWFPFARDADYSGLLVVDFDPSDLGNKGQVFFIPDEDSPGIFVAPSFDALVELRMRQLAVTWHEIRDGHYASLLCTTCKHPWDPAQEIDPTMCSCGSPTLFVEM